MEHIDQILCLDFLLRRSRWLVVNGRSIYTQQIRHSAYWQFFFNPLGAEYIYFPSRVQTLSQIFLEPVNLCGQLSDFLIQSIRFAGSLLSHTFFVEFS
jgi:hypothetical protein